MSELDKKYYVIVFHPSGVEKRRIGPFWKLESAKTQQLLEQSRDKGMTVEVYQLRKVS